MRDDAPYGPDEPPRLPDDGAARGRVTPPAMLLLIVGVMNLLFGLFLLVRSINLKQDTSEADANVEKLWEDNPAQKEAVQQFGIQSAHDAVISSLNLLLGYGGLSALVAVFAVFGSIRMLGLRSYGLAMFGAILTAIPCVTPCCLIGQIAGLWAIIVLMNPEVRKAFH